MKPIPLNSKRGLSIILLLVATFSIAGYYIGVVHAVAPSTAWTLANNVAIAWKDSTGTVQKLLYLDASNIFQIGGSNALITIGEKANSGSALIISDGTTNYFVMDTRTATSGVIAYSFGVSNPTIASAAGATYNTVTVTPPTLTLTGTTTVTAINGLGLNIGAPAITDTSAVTVTTASSLYIVAAPTAGGSVTMTNPFALQVAAGTSAFGGPIIFNAASIPASGVAGIGADANAGNLILNVPTAKQFQFFVNGVQESAFDSNGNLILLGTVLPAGTSTYYAANGSGDPVINGPFGVNLAVGGTTAFRALPGSIAIINGIVTQGKGVPAIYGEGLSTGQTGSLASVAAYSPAAAGRFLVCGDIIVNSITGGSVNLQVTYTDRGGTARTSTMLFSQGTATLLVSLTATGDFPALCQEITSNGSAITVKTTAVATINYDVTASIAQVG